MSVPFLRPDGSGVRLRLLVRPKSSADRVAGIHGDRLKVAVRAAPEKGKANRAVVALLAPLLGVARSRIAVTQGEASPQKEIRVEGLDAGTLEKKVEALGWTR